MIRIFNEFSSSESSLKLSIAFRRFGSVAS